MSVLRIRRSLGILLLLALLGAVGCTDEKKEVRKALKPYLEAKTKLDEEKAWSLVTQEDQSAGTKEALFMNLGPVEKTVYDEVVADAFTYDIKSVEVDGDRAEATVEVSGPPREMMWANLLEYRKSSEDKREETKAKIKEALSDSSRHEKKTYTYVLKKSDDEWRIYLDLGDRKKVEGGVKKVRSMLRKGDEKAAKERLAALQNIEFDGSEPEMIAETLADAENFVARRKSQEQLNNLLTKAHTASDDKTRHAALEKLKMVVSRMESEGLDVSQEKERIAALERAVSHKERVEEYAPQLQVEIEAERDASGLVMVDGNVKNNGDGLVKMVELALIFVSESGRELEQISFVPFEHEELEPGDDVSFEYKTPSAPPGWEDGKVRAKVIDVVVGDR